MRKFILMSGVVMAGVLVSEAQATTYRFSVSCQDRRTVAVWETGAIDPGKEYLRVITGTKNPNCSISDYNEATDANLPTDRYSDVGGVISGLPPVAIICGIFDC